MIRYKFTEKEILSDINVLNPKWLSKADKLKREIRKKPDKPPKSIWSEIKSVYTKRQHGKCAYCERSLGEHESSSVEIDVEHFRPKNSVKAWPTDEIAIELGLSKSFPRSLGTGKGYRHLAYHHANYASSCKTCNSSLKGSFFPIAGTHDFKSDDPSSLQKSEKPYLIYPLADIDQDPEDLIAFQGYLPIPAVPSGHDHDRALVTINFFRLGTDREDLFLSRAKQLDSVYTKIQLMALSSAKKRKEIWRDILSLASEKNDHAGCVRSLLKLYGKPEQKPIPKSRKEALQYLALAQDYVRSKLK